MHIIKVIITQQPLQILLLWFLCHSVGGYVIARPVMDMSQQDLVNPVSVLYVFAYITPYRLRMKAYTPDSSLPAHNLNKKLRHC